MMTINTYDSGLLRMSMRANAIFSAASALICLLFARAVAATLGLGADGAGEIVQQGISLLIFAAFLFITSSRMTENRGRILIVSGAIAIILDLLWVIGSAVLLITDAMSLSAAGKWIVAIIAVFVLDFAIFQSLGLRRVLKSTTFQEAHA